MQVTACGFRKWLTRPMSGRQRGDMKVLAHIREQYGLSLGSAVYPERPPFGQSKGSPSHDNGPQRGWPRCWRTPRWQRNRLKHLNKIDQRVIAQRALADFAVDVDMLQNIFKPILVLVFKLAMGAFGHAGTASS